MMDNIISNLRKDEMYAGDLKSIPDSILRKFIYGLFENGMHDIGNGMKIIDAYTNSRGVEVLTSLFCSENTSSFLQYGLIEEKVNHITGNNYYEVSGNALGHSIWLFARKKENSASQAVGDGVAKHVVPRADEASPQVVMLCKKYGYLATSELQARRESLEARRKKMMLQVARARATGRGNYTSVCATEGSAERFASIVDDYDIALMERGVIV
ncbi:TPA: hypothetical protein U5E37_003740 [Yersinia enterocolitica]|nr:hypothetical protein [Yersinia enterocolitica]